MSRGPVVLLLAALLLTGCGGSAEEEPGRGDKPATKAATSPAPVEPTPKLSAEDTLEEALARLSDADTGTYQQTLLWAGVAVIQLGGDYVLSEEALELTGLRSIPLRPNLTERFEIVVQDGRHLLKLRGPERSTRGCWVPMRLPQAQRVFGMSGPRFAFGVYDLLSHVRVTGIRRVNQTIEGRLDLRLVAPLFGARFADLVAGTDAERRGSVPMEITLADGELHGWEVEGPAVLQELHRHRFPRLRRASYVWDMIFTVRFTPNDEVRIELPDEEHIAVGLRAGCAASGRSA